MLEVSELGRRRLCVFGCDRLCRLSKTVLINPDAQHHCEGSCRKATGEGEACWTAEPIQP